MAITKAVVLLSGGQDSTTCLFWAKERFDVVVAVSFDYGQRHRAELAAAKEIAALAGVEHHLLPLEVLTALGDSALTSNRAVEATGGLFDKEAPNGLPTSFVPGRNLLFLSVAAALAVKVGATNIVCGVCETDYSGYPDCRGTFVQAMERVVNEAMPSGSGPLVIHAPLLHLSKQATVELARVLPGCWEALAKSLTCYEGLRPGCGACPACVLREKGFAAAGVADPAKT